MSTDTPIDLGDDDGYVTVVVAGTEARLDLYEASNRITDYHRAHQKHPDAEYNQGLVELMQELGLPPVSHRMAARFVAAINARIEALKKNGEVSASSPASTDSTPVI